MHKHRTRIAYVTDVEGNYEWFCNYVAISEGLHFTNSSDGRDVRHVDRDDPGIELANGWHFVFGGDCSDKGYGSIRVVKTLIALKRKYPTRVHLLLGNRDINKMRFVSELHPSQLKHENLWRVEGRAYWDKRAKNAGEFVRSVAAKKEGVPDEDATEVMLQLHDTPINRLDWILSATMGSAGDIERRRAELAWIYNGVPTPPHEPAQPENGTAPHDWAKTRAHMVSDAEVFQSYVDSAQPTATGTSSDIDNFMTEYLELGVLGIVLGDTLFVHGGVIALSWDHVIGLIPNQPFYQAPTRHVSSGNGRSRDGSAGADVCVDVLKWLEDLNRWKDRQLQEWRDTPTWQTTLATDDAPDSTTERFSIDTPTAATVRGGVFSFADTDLGVSAAAGAGADVQLPDPPQGGGGAFGARRGGEWLMDYALATDRPGVVCGRHLTKSSMGRHTQRGTVRTLNNSGIRRLVAGHTPHGNCPTVIKSVYLANDHDDDDDDNDGSAHADLLSMCTDDYQCGETALLSLEVVMADSSFSDMSSDDNRGRAVSEVIVLLPPVNAVPPYSPQRTDTVSHTGMFSRYRSLTSSALRYNELPTGYRSWCYVHGSLDDGRMLSYWTHDPLIGRFEPAGTPNARFVKTKLVAGTVDQLSRHSSDAGSFTPDSLRVPPPKPTDQYLMCHVEGFKYTYGVTTYEELAKDLLQNYNPQKYVYASRTGHLSSSSTSSSSEPSARPVHFGACIDPSVSAGAALVVGCGSSGSTERVSSVRPKEAMFMGRELARLSVETVEVSRPEIKMSKSVPAQLDVLGDEVAPIIADVFRRSASCDSASSHGNIGAVGMSVRGANSRWMQVVQRCRMRSLLEQTQSYDQQHRTVWVKRGGN